MDPQTALLVALALLTVAGIFVGIAGVALFRLMSADDGPDAVGSAAPAVDVDDAVETPEREP